MLAALLTDLRAPLTVGELLPAPLRYGQVLVKVLVSGICGAQLQEIDGKKQGGPLPHPLGHEGVGIVSEVGPGVTKVREGDKTILHWRKGDGIESEFPRYIYRGSEITGGRVTTFQEYTIASENRLTPVPHDIPNDFCALLGCSLSTALGTIEHEARVKFGESVLIVGCGGLGTSLIVAAKMAGAYPVLVHDIQDKRDLATTLGADWATFGDEWPDRKFDVIVDTSGAVSALENTLPLLSDSGRYLMVGQPEGDVRIFAAKHLFGGTGKSIKATQGGCFNPTSDIPRYINLYRSGALKLDGIISHRVSLDNINEGIAAVRNGQAGRVMVDMI